MEKRQEQGIAENDKHIPNRIFRGRVVEFVRNNRGKQIFLEEFGKKIKKDYKADEEKCLLSLLEKLQTDGLLNYDLAGNKITLSLPDYDYSSFSINYALFLLPPEQRRLSRCR